MKKLRGILLSMTAVENLFALAQGHETVAGSSGAVTGGAEARDISHFH